jgi:hypothetical protein
MTPHETAELVVTMWLDADPTREIPCARLSSAHARGKARNYPYWGAVRYAIAINRQGHVSALPRGRATSDRRSLKLGERDTLTLAENIGGIVIRSIGKLSPEDWVKAADWLAAKYPEAVHYERATHAHV